VKRLTVKRLTVVADGFHGAALERLHTLGFFFFILGLLEADVVVFVVRHTKVLRSSVGTHRAEDALLVHIKLSTYIIGPFTFFVSHKTPSSVEESIPLKPEYTMLQDFPRPKEPRSIVTLGAPLPL